MLPVDFLEALNLAAIGGGLLTYVNGSLRFQSKRQLEIWHSVCAISTKLGRNGSMVDLLSTEPVQFREIEETQIMKTIAIKADEALWQNNMLPEGVVVRWFVADGDLARAGHRMAEVRIEGALHDIVAPADGRVKIEIGASSVIEPGSLLATLASTAA